MYIISDFNKICNSFVFFFLIEILYFFYTKKGEDENGYLDHIKKVYHIVIITKIIHHYSFVCNKNIIVYKVSDTMYNNNMLKLFYKDEIQTSFTMLGEIQIVGGIT